MHTRTHMRILIPSLSRGVVLALVLFGSCSARAAVNHGLFITGPFASGPDVTSKCLSCHGEGGQLGKQVDVDFMATVHWTWQADNNGQDLGKRNVINNYCVAVGSNEPRCTSCHAGYGWRDDGFDFADPTKIDCLVCHEQTGTYKKTPTGAGDPDPTVDLLAAARSVGKPTRANCGTCHFFGGGGDAVKHGDLDSTMLNPGRELDVHQNTDGTPFACIECHKGVAHEIPGSRYSKSAPDSQMCLDCHLERNGGASVHASGLLNGHVERIGCQTCHVPTFARGGKATKMSWDWSTAGQDLPSNPDAWGNPTYDKKKGSFTWDANVVPDYVWFNGQVVYTTLDDAVRGGERVTINKLQGAYDDVNARLIPVKRFTGVQPYDAVYQTLVVPHLYPTSADDSRAYWKSYDWDLAAAAGMSYVGRPYSGDLGWVETEMFWVQNHMVAPKEQALTCTDCHTLDGRIQFADLGYPADRARALQNRYFKVDRTRTVGSDSVELQWKGAAGFSYQVQFTTDLNADPVEWLPADQGSFTVDPSTVGSVSLQWEEGVPGEPRFYRVIRTDDLQ